MQTRSRSRSPPFTLEVFFEHNIPRKLRRVLKGHYVSIAEEMLWARLENGDLLRAAEDEGCDVMVTADKNISYQQNLSGRLLALIVLSTNDWNIIQHNTVPIVSAVEAVTPGSFQNVFIDPASKED